MNKTSSYSRLPPETRGRYRAKRILFFARKCFLLMEPRKSWLIPALIGIGGFFLSGEIREPLFSPMKLSMYFCIFSVIWGWYSTCRTNLSDYRELLAAYGVSERTGHLVRLLVISLFGALTTVSLLVGMMFGGVQDIEMLVVGLWWLPHIILGHFISTAIGGLGALMGVSHDGNELLLSILSWFGLAELSHRMGTVIPLLLTFILTAVLLAVVNTLLLTALVHHTEWGNRR